MDIELDFTGLPLFGNYDFKNTPNLGDYFMVDINISPSISEIIYIGLPSDLTEFKLESGKISSLNLSRLFNKHYHEYMFKPIVEILDRENLKSLAYNKSLREFVLFTCSTYEGFDKAEISFWHGSKDIANVINKFMNLRFTTWINKNCDYMKLLRNLKFYFEFHDMLPHIKDFTISIKKPDGALEKYNFLLEK